MAKSTGILKQAVQIHINLSQFVTQSSKDPEIGDEAYMLPPCMQFSLKLMGAACPSDVEHKLWTVKCTVCFRKTPKIDASSLSSGKPYRAVMAGQDRAFRQGLNSFFYTVRTPSHADGFLKNLQELITSSKNEKAEKPLMFELLSPTFLSPTQGPQILLSLYQNPQSATYSKLYFHTAKEKIESEVTSHVKCKVWSSTSTTVLIKARAQISGAAEPPAVLGACKRRSLQEMMMNHLLALWEVLKLFKDVESASATWLTASIPGQEACWENFCWLLPKREIQSTRRDLWPSKRSPDICNTQQLCLPLPGLSVSLWHTDSCGIQNTPIVLTASWTTSPAMNITKWYQLNVGEAGKMSGMMEKL